MRNVVKLLKYLFIIAIIYVLVRYTFVFVLLWGFIEIVIFSIRRKSIKRIRLFICNFVITILNCIDILTNIVLQIPANRILLITYKKCLRFGNPEDSFTKVLRTNFLYDNLKPRGIILYNIISFFKKDLK